jgi:hypothetical protein
VFAIEFNKARVLWDSGIYQVSGLFQDIAHNQIILASTYGKIEVYNMTTATFRSFQIPNATKTGAGFVDTTTNKFYIFTAQNEIIHLINIDLVDFDRVSGTMEISDINAVPHCSIFDEESGNLAYSMWYNTGRYVNIITRDAGTIDTLSGAAGSYSCSYIPGKQSGLFVGVNTNNVMLYEVMMRKSPPQVYGQGVPINLICPSCVMEVHITTDLADTMYMATANLPGLSTVHEFHYADAHNLHRMSMNNTEKVTGLMVDVTTKQPYLFSDLNSLIEPDIEFFETFERNNLWNNNRPLRFQGFGYINGSVAYVCDRFGDVYVLSEAEPTEKPTQRPTTAPTLKPTEASTMSPTDPPADTFWGRIVAFLKLMVKKKA